MNVFLIAAITADGFIAEETQQISTAWTSKEDKKFFSERTKQAGVIIMGAKTFATIGRVLPGRLNIIYSNRPATEVASGIVDPNLRVTNVPPADLLKQLEDEGYKEVAICGGTTIYSLFLRAGLIQKIYLTIEPVLFGTGVKLLGEHVLMPLHLMNTQKLSEQTILLEYDVVKAG